jgi:hypothetical protein
VEMETDKIINTEFNARIEEFLNEFISTIYRGHDHIIARKYYHELFQSLIPAYFCICSEDKAETGPKTSGKI